MTTSQHERIVELTGQRVGDATQRLVDLARQAGYSVGATTPGTFQLARHRRRLLGSRTESVSITVYEDRVGVKARVVGPVDPALLDNLAVGEPTRESAQIWSNGDSVAAAPTDVPQAPEPAAHPEPRPRPAPVPPPTGLIGSVPGPGAPAPVPATVPDESADDGRTVLRPPTASQLPAPRPAPASSNGSRAGLVLPDGRFVEMSTSVVIGRNPDPSLGPDGAVALAVDDPSLSKTHLAVSSRAEKLVVVDLHSTNGTFIESGADRERCVPGQGHVVGGETGSIRAGNVVFEVRVA